MQSWEFWVYQDCSMGYFLIPTTELLCAWLCRDCSMTTVMGGRVNIPVSMFTKVLISVLLSGTSLTRPRNAHGQYLYLLDTSRWFGAIFNNSCANGWCCGTFSDLNLHLAIPTYVQTLEICSLLICARIQFGIWMSTQEGSSVLLLALPHVFLPRSPQCNADCHNFPSRNSQSLLFCAVINIRSETLAGNVNLDRASKTQQNNWWSCQV